MNDKHPLAEWLKIYQGIDAPADAPDPSRAPGNAGDLVQGHISELTFDTETATFVSLLHRLAPESLRDE